MGVKKPPIFQRRNAKKLLPLSPRVLSSYSLLFVQAH